MDEYLWVKEKNDFIHKIFDERLSELDNFIIRRSSRNENSKNLSKL